LPTTAAPAPGPDTTQHRSVQATTNAAVTAGERPCR
jgi:hypothetical protein